MPKVEWTFVGNAKIVGDELVCVADKEHPDAYAVGRCDLARYDGKPLQVHVTASSEGVVKPSEPHLGFQFVVSYLDVQLGGNRVYPGGERLTGDVAPREILFRDINPKTRGEAEIRLGLMGTTGKAVFNLKTFQARATSSAVPKVNAGYKVKYPDRIRNLPRQRGFMLGDTGGNAWQTLSDWGVTLVRHQMTCRGTGKAQDHETYVKGYYANFDKCLDALEVNLKEAQKRGILVCIDQHSPPGGGCDAGDPAEWRGDCRMFHDPVYAQLFIDCWVKLVKRMAPYRDAIYGYDLINEAYHNSPALPDGDIVSLQRRCAEAIRAIDPDTPIVLESMFCDPGWFAEMSAIKMDNVIYQVHLYYPHDYTHQGVYRKDEILHWPDPKKGWNRDFLVKALKPVIDFQKEHDAKMFVGEFSAIAWAPEAEDYITDCISIFEELGWDWTYHAFREYQGWSVEHEAVGRGLPGAEWKPSKTNPRMEAVKKGLRGEIGGADGRIGSVSRPGAFHRAEIRAHVGIPSIAVSPVNGRMWATWYNGKTRGEDMYNYVTLVTSADGGKHWNEVLVADPDGDGPKRSFDPELWIAPDGKLRWSWTERVCDPTKGDPTKDYGLDQGDPKTDVVKMATLSAEDEPTGPVPTVDVGHGVMMCKPTVLKNGEWLMPLAHWNEAPSSCFYVSKDNGKTFEYRGGATIPKELRLYDEHQAVQRANGDLVVFIRTNWNAKDERFRPQMAVSKDDGRTWGPAEPATYHHTSSRVFVTRLKSGNWLLVKHGPVDQNVGRKELTAYLSKDEGRTWSGGLMLDKREGVSYPDGQQLPDGSIVVIYDWNRLSDKAILFATFTEEDVLAGGDVSGKVRLRRKISVGNKLQ